MRYLMRRSPPCLEVSGTRLSCALGTYCIFFRRSPLSRVESRYTTTIVMDDTCPSSSSCPLPSLPTETSPMHHSLNSVACNIPMRGLQYLNAPSMPGPIQKAYQDTVTSTPRITFNASTNHRGLLPAVQDAVRATGGSYSLDETLSHIGPAARRLLLLDTTNEQALASTNVTAKANHRNRTHGGAGRRLEKSSPSPAVREFLSATAPLPACESSSRHGTLTGSRACRSGIPRFSNMLTTPSVTASLRVTMTRQSNQQKSDGVREVPVYQSTLSRKPQSEPPLVVMLRQYLNQEVHLAQDGCLAPTPLDQIGPYREAFGAFIEAFPGYQAILCDIQSAYDNVIQFQAELLSGVSTRETETAREVAQHHEVLASLQTTITGLESELQVTRHQSKERREEAEVLKDRAGHAPATGTSVIDLRRQLDQAKSRQQHLEEMSKGDLEKIMILIGALRECDKCMKELEISVTKMSGQVEELEEFQRVAAEAQSELQQYKQRYEAYVPLSDFDSMRAYLMEELAAAKKTSRRMRRTAAVRGTQVDVMNRRLQVFEKEIEELKAAGSATSIAARLTPRPNWAEIYKELPELGDYTKKVHCAPLTLKEKETVIGEDEGLPRDATDEGEILVVEGPVNTELQIRYLVNRINILQRRVAELEATQLTTEYRDNIAHAMEIALVGRPQPAKQSEGTSSSARGNIFSGRAGSHKVRTGPTDIYPLAFQRPMPMPIIGPGVSESVPRYFRAAGLVARLPINPIISVELVFNFFAKVVQPVVGDRCLFSGLNLAEMFYNFLTEEVAIRESLCAYPCASHLALNLEEDARDPQLSNPATFLLSNILRGVMPPRLGIDAGMVVARVIGDIRAMAVELNKPRVRRQAVGECIQPILELKSSEEVAELRNCLGNDVTFEVTSLTSTGNRFIRALLYQECQENMTLFTNLVSAFSERAEGEADSLGERRISLANIADAVLEVEPLTPAIVVRELSENALGNPEDSTFSVDGEALVRLSEVIRAVGEAPLLRRSPRLTKEECAL